MPAIPGAERLGLRDGRTLEVLVSGPADGPVLVFHHGTPGCALQRRGMARAAADLGLRMVTYSRAGYAGSTRRPGRSVADVAQDVAELLDHLGAERCVTAGWSGGGPHALATAALLPDRVAAVLSIAGVRPYGDGEGFLAGMGEQNVEEFGLALEGEGALRPWLEREAAGMAGTDAAGLIEALSTLLPEVDRAVLTDEVAEDMLASMDAGVRPVDGWLDDDLAFVRPWGFEPGDVAVPSYVWQGSADLMVPFAHGEHLVAALPGAEAHLLEGEGHLSVGIGAMPQMLGQLARHL